MEIRIGKSAHHCHGCQTVFAHEQGLTSTVQRSEDGWARLDYCANCWDKEKSSDAFSVWTAVYHDPHVIAQGPAEVFSPLRQAFYEAVEKQERPSVAVAYLAAQLLRRQKVFRRIKETIDPDSDAALLLFSDRIGNRLIEVSDPNLSTPELERGRQTLMQRLAELEAIDEDVSESDETIEEGITHNGENQGQYAQA